MSDRDYMRLALDLAERGRWTARPNPMVGAVVVKGGRVVGSGYHARPGSGHAEVEALKDVSDEDARGATVYVTLEPCCFTGRTPPCTDLLVARRVGRVVCALEDPDRRVAGRGFDRLREAGIEVTTGVLARDAERVNAAYVTHRRLGRPFVTLKLAQSVDGSTSLANGVSRWITGPRARRRGHALRAEAQAIAVGIGTILADDPQLTVRHCTGADPIRIVFDSALKIPDRARVLDGGRCVVCAAESAPADRVSRLRDLGVDVWQCGDQDGRPDVKKALARLAETDVIHLLVEGGAAVAGSFVKARAVDRVSVFTGPKLMAGRPGIGDAGFGSMADVARIENVEVERLGADVMLTGDVRFG